MINKEVTLLHPQFPAMYEELSLSDQWLTRKFPPNHPHHKKQTERRRWSVAAGVCYKTERYRQTDRQKYDQDLLVLPYKTKKLGFINGGSSRQSIKVHYPTCTNCGSRSTNSSSLMPSWTHLTAAERTSWSVNLKSANHAARAPCKVTGVHTDNTVTSSRWSYSAQGSAAPYVAYLESSSSRAQTGAKGGQERSRE